MRLQIVDSLYTRKKFHTNVFFVTLNTFIIYILRFWCCYILVIERKRHIWHTHSLRSGLAQNCLSDCKFHWMKRRGWKNHQLVKYIIHLHWCTAVAIILILVMQSNNDISTPIRCCYWHVPSLFGIMLLLPGFAGHVKMKCQKLNFYPEPKLYETGECVTVLDK